MTTAHSRMKPRNAFRGIRTNLVSPLAGAAPPSPQAEKPKTVCESWARQGTCPYGNRCLFEHPASMQPPQAPVKQIFVSPLGFNNEFRKMKTEMKLALLHETVGVDKPAAPPNDSLVNPPSESMLSKNNNSHHQNSASSTCSSDSVLSHELEANTSICYTNTSMCCANTSMGGSPKPLRLARPLPIARNLQRRRTLIGENPTSD